MNQKHNQILSIFQLSVQFKNTPQKEDRLPML